MNTDTKPDRPAPPLPVEAEIRTEDLEQPSPEDAAQDPEHADDEEEPGKGENVPGFLKPDRR